MNNSKPQSQNLLRWFFFRSRGDSPAVQLVIHIFLLLCSIIAIYPIVRVFTLSLGPVSKSLIDPFVIIPPDASLFNYITLFRDKDFIQWILNSFIITIAVSAIGVALSATGAYAFSRWKFPGRTQALFFLLATQAIPAGMLLIPIYLMLARFGMTNHYNGLALAYSVSSVPFSIWILKGYYDTVPFDLEESALIDGCSRLEAFWRIVLPLSTPALAIVFLFNFMNAWSEFVVAYRILQNQTLWTWPIGINSLQGQFAKEWGMYAAASLMITVPVMALFLYSSKWLISGLTLGSVKG
jgi:arabinogalactan oligomer/maltooligosaccharide transport system permease protein